MNRNTINCNMDGVLSEKGSMVVFKDENGKIQGSLTSTSYPGYYPEGWSFYVCHKEDVAELSAEAIERAFY